MSNKKEFNMTQHGQMFTYEGRPKNKNLDSHAVKEISGIVNASTRLYNH